MTTYHKEIIYLFIFNKITNKNKKLHETSKINSRIVELARHHRIKLIDFENLNMKKNYKNKRIGIRL
jgi:hypothetical protein